MRHKKQQNTRKRSNVDATHTKPFDEKHVRGINRVSIIHIDLHTPCAHELPSLEYVNNFLNSEPEVPTVLQAM